MPKQISKLRIRIVLGFLLLIVFFIFFNLYELQVVKHRDFELISGRQYFNPYQDNSSRGSIIFKYRDGRDFFAATNKTGYTIEINPSIIKNPEDTYNILSNYLDLDLEDYLTKANKVGDTSEVLAKKVDIDTAEKIIDLGLQGVIV
jgi:cell division protein FtsI/penicillin-binding protein 2